MKFYKELFLLVFGLSLGLGLSYFARVVKADNTSEIHACSNESYGLLRIVQDNQACKSNELPLSWNIAGPQGPQGPQGPPGVAGAGSVAFINGNSMLTNSGDIWIFSIANNWQKQSSLPAEIPVSNIAQWEGNILLTKDGDYWEKINDVWQNFYHP